MKATRKGMAGYTSNELVIYVAETDAMYRNSPRFIRRTSYSRWFSNRRAILREVDRRGVLA